MTVKDHKGGKLLILSKPFDSRVKALEASYGLIFFIGFCAALLVLIISNLDALGSLFLVAAIIIQFMIFKKFANTAFLSERIFITRTELSLIKKKLFSSEQVSYEINRISHLRYLGKPELTRHPLAGDNFDYLGFQTEQQLINEVHGDNKLSFRYDGKTVTFGNNIYSWDFDQIEALLYDVTGNDLRYENSVEKQMLTELEKQDDEI
jgi:hypothetical protein